MRYVNIGNIHPGMILQEPILQGEVVVVDSGSELTPEICAELKELGVPGIYITECPDIQVKTLISHSLRGEAYAALMKNEYLTAIEDAEKIAIYLMNNRNCLDLALHHTEIKTNRNHTQQHEISVCIYSTCLAIHSDLPEEIIFDTAKAAILHDIGKNMLPKSILHKKEKLSDMEWEMIRTHPYIAYQTLVNLPQLSREAKEAILHHHENIDGSGYYGVPGDKLNICTRIIHVADVYDAMVSNRKYREKPFSREKAFEFLLSHSGTHFDAELVQEFDKMIPEYQIAHDISILIGQNKVTATIADIAEDGNLVINIPN